MPEIETENLSQEEKNAFEEAKTKKESDGSKENDLDFKSDDSREEKNLGDSREEKASNEASTEESEKKGESDIQNDSLKEQLAAANDRNLRLIAEFDNFRRRTAKEQLDLIETANGKLLEKLSEVLDNFERAFAAENKAKDLETFEKGMQMIHSQFSKILSEAGLEAIDPTGEPFDPNSQEALMQQPSEDIPEGNVVLVFQKGYRLKNKILKTAKVIVSSGK